MYGSYFLSTLGWSMSEIKGFVGTCFGNYRVTAEIGSGGYGIVYRGEHTILTEREVAIKMLHAHLRASEERERFLQEAHLLERLKHPYILHIFDVGIHEGFPYLVSEYASQGSLRNLLKSYAPHPLPVPVALTILTQIGQALYYAHEQHIVHRDLKPENILFNTQGDALLVDFGIATTMSTASIKQVNIVGTPSYMAPEQFQGSVSKESDQYSLGCIAYELFTGQPPFAPTEFFVMGFNHLTKAPVAPRQLNPALPPSIEQAILKATAKQRHLRHADIKAFISALHSPTNAQPQPFAPGLSASYMLDKTDTSLAKAGEHTTQIPVIYSANDFNTHQPTMKQGPETPLPEVYPSFMGAAGAGPSPNLITGQTERPLYASATPALWETPITGIPNSNSIHGNSNTAYPVKQRSIRGPKLLIAIAVLLVLASLLATLPQFFANHAPQSQGTLQNTPVQQFVSTNPAGTTGTTVATHVPVHTKHGQPTPVATLIPGTTPTTIATHVATPAITPTSVPTSTPTPSPVTDTLIIYYINGTSGVATTHSYSGKVTIHITGAGEEYTNKWLDAFYQYTDSNGGSITPVHSDTYPGWTLWINGGMADAYVSPIPAYNSNHDYTFTINAPGGVLTFAIGDTYAKDNSGSLTATITQD